MRLIDEAGPCWVDTVGWEERDTDNTTIFQVTLTHPTVSHLAPAGHLEVSEQQRTTEDISHRLVCFS